MLIEGKIHNLSYNNIQGRIEVDIFVCDDSDPVLVTEAVLMSAYMEPAVLQEPPPKVLFLGFQDNAFKFQLWVWVNEIYNEPIYTSSLRFLIQHNLHQQGILIPWDNFNIYLHHPEDSKKFELSQKTVIHGLKSHQSIPDKPLSARDLLMEVTYFKNFTDVELRKLIEVGYRKRIKPLDFLFHEGDPGDAFYIILSGSVEVFVEKINKHLTTLKAGKFFGELALILGIPRTASVRAIEDTILFAINKKGFEKILHENPELAEVILQEFGKHKEELFQRQSELRTLGLVDIEEDDKNIIVWVRSRFKNLFNL
jgi:CRP-like cAMP-binding protein